MSMLPVLLGIVTALCWGTADFLSRKMAIQIGYYKTTVYTTLVGTAGLLLLAPLLTVEFNLTINIMALMLLVGLTSFIAGLLLFRSYQHGVLSIVAPIVYTYPAITAIMAAIFLGKTLSISQYSAMSGVILGVALLSTRLSDLKRIIRRRNLVAITPGVGTAIIAAILYGGSLLGLGITTIATGYLLPAIVTRGASLIIGVSVSPFFGQAVELKRLLISRLVLMIGALETAGLLAFNFAVFIEADSLPIVTALSGAAAAFLVAYAILFVGEKPETNQWLGILLSIIAVCSLLYLST